MVEPPLDNAAMPQLLGMLPAFITLIGAYCVETNAIAVIPEGNVAVAVVVLDVPLM